MDIFKVSDCVGEVIDIFLHSNTPNPEIMEDTVFIHAARKGLNNKESELIIQLYYFILSCIFYKPFITMPVSIPHYELVKRVVDAYNEEFPFPDISIIIFEYFFTSKIEFDCYNSFLKNISTSLVTIAGMYSSPICAGRA